MIVKDDLRRERLMGELRKALKDRGISGEKFARSIGMSPSYFSMILNGKRGIDDDFLSVVGRQIPEMQIKINNYLFS